MIRIQRGTPEGPQSYSFERFEDEFLKICNEHISQGRATLFAFLLYDLRTPQIEKILEDRSYWGALNAVAGPYLTVFAFHRDAPPAAPMVERRWLHSITPASSEFASVILQRYFSLDGDYAAPSLLFFQVDDNGVSDSFFAKIRSEKVEDAYLEIRNVLEGAASMVKHVGSAVADRHRLFDLIEREIKGRNIASQLIRAAKKVSSLKDVVGLLRVLSPV